MAFPEFNRRRSAPATFDLDEDQLQGPRHQSSDTTEQAEGNQGDQYLQQTDQASNHSGQVDAIKNNEHKNLEGQGSDERCQAVENEGQLEDQDDQAFNLKEQAERIEKHQRQDQENMSFNPKEQAAAIDEDQHHEPCQRYVGTDTDLRQNHEESSADPDVQVSVHKHLIEDEIDFGDVMSDVTDAIERLDMLLQQKGEITKTINEYQALYFSEDENKPVSASFIQRADLLEEAKIASCEGMISLHKDIKDMATLESNASSAEATMDGSVKFSVLPVISEYLEDVINVFYTDPEIQ